MSGQRKGSEAPGKGPESPETDRPWHSIGPDDAVAAFDTDAERGLSRETAAARREDFGANRLPERGRETLFGTVLRQFRDPLIYVLLIAGAVSIAIGNLSDAGFIFAVLAFNASLGTYQEYTAESAAQALEQTMRITARVVREGRTREVDSEELVPGDLVRVGSGDRVPADMRLIETQDLRADESLLTGESVPVTKRAGDTPEADAPIDARTTLLHAGSAVASGRATGVVVRTGPATELGQISTSLTEEEQLPPLVLRMKRFTRIIAIAILTVIVVLAGIQALRGAAPVDIFFLAVALAVSAIPAGLPVAVTVALSIGSRRMARRNAIVRKLPAVEGLGACTLIASDKTGTLTRNRLTARRILSPEGATLEVSGAGYETEGEITREGEEVDEEDWLRDLVITGALCNEAELAETDEGAPEVSGDAVDVAFLVLARKLGLSREALLEERPQVGQIPFESERRFAVTFHETEDGRTLAHAKGAAEVIAGLADVDTAEVEALEDALADEGYRVLALAQGEVDGETARQADPETLPDLRFLGLVGLIDPVRDAVPEAVERCRAAGVEVRMVTGDHPLTAQIIARELGLSGDDDDAVTGREIADLSGDTPRRRARILESPVFARIEPAQKTEIVDTLQEAGHFVTVTGDGVNDAPALRSAHIGVSMGKSGTDVARNASDLILTDDNFASIVAGIEEGRVAYDNIRKVVWLLVSTGTAELMLFILSVAFDTPLPLAPVQLLWLNLVTNGIQDVALAFERGEPGVLDRPPRAPGEPIFDRLMIEEVLVSGLYMGGVAFGAFYYLTEMRGVGEAEARNLLLLLMVLFSNIHVFNVRSETRSAFRIPLSHNPLLIGAVVVAQGVHIGSMFVPGWRDVLQIAPVAPETWGLLLAITLSKFLVVEAYKHLRGRRLAAAARRNARDSGPTARRGMQGARN